VAGLTRKELKTDRFAQEVGHTVEYVEAHRRQIIRYALAALALIVIVGGVYLYRQRQHTARQQELGAAMEILEAAIVPAGAASGSHVTFPTQQAKDEAALKALTEIAVKHSGSDEADIATYFRGGILADQGKLAEAETLLKSVADNGDAEYAALAKLALSQIYFTTARLQQAENTLRELMASPTTFVSKEQATIALAQGLMKTKPAEAKKLLEPLRTSRSTVSQAAIQLYADLTAAP
jgi:hypothetical protein